MASTAKLIWRMIVLSTLLFLSFDLCSAQPLPSTLTTSHSETSTTLTSSPKVHTTPMLILGPDHLPFTEIVRSQEKENFYACDGVVSGWFLNIVSEEMNYFAALSKLVSIDKSACIVSIENEKSLTPGLITIRLYQNMQQLSDCIERHKCKIEHNVTLQIKHNQIYRSYFLTDMNNERFVQHCVSDQGQWFKNTNCYKVE